MIVTARQLEELHREGGENGRITLRAGTRLSPLAREWIRKTKVELNYVDAANQPSSESVGLRRVAWWCDGECAVAKSALMSFGDSVNLEAIKLSSDSSQTVTAVRKLAEQILSHRANTGVLMLTSAGAATVQANRIPEIRAIVATTPESVDTAMSSISPNVLIVEHSNRSFTEIRNVLARFVRGGVA